MSNLKDMQEEVYKVNLSNGWFDADRDFGTDLALLNSEVSEMFEAYRDHGFKDMTVQVAPGERLPKPEGFGSEAADVLVRILDTNYRWQLGLSALTLEEVEPHPKFDPSASVGQHISRLHAFVIHCTRATTLDPLLSYLKTWCDHLDINLQAEFDRKLAYNAIRGYRHGGKRV